MDLYWSVGMSDREIGLTCGLGNRDVGRLRGVYGIETDPRYLLRRNPLRFQPLSDFQREFLHGTLFGDSCIAEQMSGTCLWRCRHALGQEQYLLSKASIMKPFTAKVFYGERPFEDGGKLFPYVDARSFSLAQFVEYRERFYPGGKKVLSLDLLAEMTPSGFAFWYMDDGSVSGYGYGFNITTYEASFLDVGGTQQVFHDVLGLHVTVNWRGNGEGKIHVLKESRDLAWEYIRPFLTSDLTHKVPTRYLPVDNQHPSLIGNGEEGSTTVSEATGLLAYAGNAQPAVGNNAGTPGTELDSVVIQSELAGNSERQAEMPARLG